MASLEEWLLSASADTETGLSIAQVTGLAETGILSRLVRILLACTKQYAWEVFPSANAGTPEYLSDQGCWLTPNRIFHQDFTNFEAVRIRQSRVLSAQVTLLVQAVLSSQER